MIFGVGISKSCHCQGWHRPRCRYCRSSVHLRLDSLIKERGANYSVVVVRMKDCLEIRKNASFVGCFVAVPDNYGSQRDNQVHHLAHSSRTETPTPRIDSRCPFLGPIHPVSNPPFPHALRMYKTVFKIAKAGTTTMPCSTGQHGIEDMRNHALNQE